jgi:ketosteroid isomerase-like protein
MVLVSGINRLDERKLANLAITVGERVAFAASVIHCAGTTTSGRSFDDRVRATFCLEKHDGAWRIAHQHVSIPAQDN